MTYDLSPSISRLVPFTTEGGALAAIDVNFGPIMVRAKLFKSATGYFLSWPARKAESGDRWYDQVAVSDPSLKARALEVALQQYKALVHGELVAV